MSVKVEGLGRSQELLKKLLGDKWKAGSNQDGIVALDEHDIKNVLKDCKTTEFYRFGIVQLGKNLDKMFGEDREVRGVAFKILGNTDLTIRDCNEIAEEFRGRTEPHAKIAWGADADKKHKRMEISVMVGR